MLGMDLDGVGGEKSLGNLKETCEDYPCYYCSNQACCCTCKFLWHMCVPGLGQYLQTVAVLLGMGWMVIALLWSTDIACPSPPSHAMLYSIEFADCSCTMYMCPFWSLLSTICSLMNSLLVFCFSCRPSLCTCTC